MPGPASKLYAQNVVNLLTLMTSEGEFAPDFEDEVVIGAAVTHSGRILHEPTREAIEGPAEAEAEPEPAPEPEASPSTEQLDLPFDSEEQQ